jgi:hypothetical protein
MLLASSYWVLYSSNKYKQFERQNHDFCHFLRAAQFFLIFMDIP